MAAGVSYGRTQVLEGVCVRVRAADSQFARLVVAAVLIGTVFVFSASFPLADRTLNGNSPHSFLLRQAAFALVGLTLLTLASYLPASWLGNAPVLWVMFTGGLVAMVLCRWGPFADETKGAYCWFNLGHGIRFQPSEFTKVVYVLLLAQVMARPPSRQWTRARVLGRTLLLLMLMCGALAVQSDLGMALLVVGVSLAMLFLRGLSVVLVGGLALVMGAAGTAFAYSSPARWQRLTGYLAPEADPLGSGYHLCRMLATLARGGLAGQGLGMNPDKWGALPYPHTDSIFCVVGAELGIVGAAGLLVLFYLLTSRAFHIAGRAGTATGWFVATGLGLLLGLQALINIGVATVSIPCTGITLPFISYGGSSLIASLIAAGIILSISRHESLEKG